MIVTISISHIERIVGDYGILNFLTRIDLNIHTHGSAGRNLGISSDCERIAGHLHAVSSADHHIRRENCNLGRAVEDKVHVRDLSSRGLCAQNKLAIERVAAAIKRDRPVNRQCLAQRDIRQESDRITVLRGLDCLCESRVRGDCAILAGDARSNVRVVGVSVIRLGERQTAFSHIFAEVVAECRAFERVVADSHLVALRVLTGGGTATEGLTEVRERVAGERHVLHALHIRTVCGTLGFSSSGDSVTRDCEVGHAIAIRSVAERVQ